jgi:RNA polymerase sigma-70 factor (family 1)
MAPQELEHNMQFPLNMGRRSSFEQVFMSYYHPLRFFISQKIAQDDAEDIVEDLFVRLWNNKTTFENEIHLKGFLYRSADNARKDFLKSHRVSKTDHLENQDFKEVQKYDFDQIKAEVYGELYRAINNLPGQCRTIISLSYIEGLTNKEIAERLSLNEQSVKNTKVRALKILKQKLPLQIFLALFSVLN